MNADFLLYGSYGYTGRLIAEEALARGLRPLLCGRDAEALGRQAAEHGLPHEVVSLKEAERLREIVAGVPVVLHAAGPFSRTSRPMADACLAAGTHYLDITGEIGVFEELAGRDAEAKRAGVMLLPGAGFDVVPTDCLAAHLKRRLPSATDLQLAFAALRGGISRGTATTMVENIAAGGAVRRGGRIIRVPAGWRTRSVELGTSRDPVEVTTIPWGDVSTAYHSTGVPDITVYTRVPRAARRAMKLSRAFGWLLGSAPVQKLLKSRIRAGKPGPTAEERARGESRVWGEVTDEKGGRAVSRMQTPEGYTLTAVASVAIVREVLAGSAPAGFQTPSSAYGADWVLGLEGVEREDVE